MFMTDDDKQIYSMVQRLSQLDKTYTKEKKSKDAEKTAAKRKREQKIQDKRDQNTKETKINRYKKAQGGNNFGGHKGGGKK